MNEKRKSPTNSRAIPEQDKDSHLEAQKKCVYSYLLSHVATASMVEDATGIKQKNITRHKRTLEDAGLLFEVKEERCQITGHKAMYLTCDPDQAPKDSQLTLF